MKSPRHPAPLWQCASRTCNHRHTEAERIRVPRPDNPGRYALACPACGGLSYFSVSRPKAHQPKETGPTPPAHYTDRPTAALQARREALLRLPRLFTTEEKAEMQAIEAELQSRNVLSIGIDF